MQILQTIPANTPALKGAVWDGSQFLDTCLDGQAIHPFVNIRTRQGVRKWPLYYGVRQNSTAYTVGKRVSINTGDAELYLECEVAGTSAASDSTINYSQIGQTVVDGGVTWRVKGLHAYKGYENWPARTNKCECVKANPVDLTNISPTGDAAVILSVASYPEILAQAGLPNICTSGKVYKIDNSAGTGQAAARIEGATGNLNDHYYSAYCLGNGFISRAGGSTLQNFSTSVLSRICLLGPGVSTTSALYVHANAGEIVYFILPQLEEGSYPTPVIIGDDSAATQTRQGSGLVFPSTGVLMVNDIALMGYVIPGPNVSQGIAYLLSCYTDDSNGVRVQANGSTLNFIKRIAGVSYYPAATDILSGTSLVLWQAYMSRYYGMGFRAKRLDTLGWSSFTNWEEDGNTDDVLIADSCELGRRNGGGHFAGEYPACMSILSSDPKAELERLATLYG